MATDLYARLLAASKNGSRAERDSADFMLRKLYGAKRSDEDRPITKEKVDRKSRFAPRTIEIAVEAYAMLLDAPDTPTREIERALGLETGSAYSAIDALEKMNLVSKRQVSQIVDGRPITQNLLSAKRIISLEDLREMFDSSHLAWG